VGSHSGIEAGSLMLPGSEPFSARFVGKIHLRTRAHLDGNGVTGTWLGNAGQVRIPSRDFGNYLPGAQGSRI
jgi:hypothetical protein